MDEEDVCVNIVEWLEWFVDFGFVVLIGIVKVSVVVIGVVIVDVLIVVMVGDVVIEIVSNFDWIDMVVDWFFIGLL